MPKDPERSGRKPDSLPPGAEPIAPIEAAELTATPAMASGRTAVRGELLDVAAVIRVAQTIASEIVLDKLLVRLMWIAIENAGAQRGILILQRDGRLMIEAAVTVDSDAVSVGPSIPVETSTNLAVSIVQYVARTREPIVVGDAAHEPRFSGDPYIAAAQPRSILCLAMTHQGRLAGIFYLENNAANDAFTRARLEFLGLLSAQAAIAVENALLYAHVKRVTEQLQHANEILEKEVTRRTDELRDANERLMLELAERERAEHARAALQEEMLQVQAARLAELSTPLIPISDGIMIMPLIGTIDTQRAHQIFETAMHGAQANRAALVIIDITGVKLVDASVGSALMMTARALRLLGVRVVLTGIRPEVAQSLIQMNIDLGSILTLGTLQSGIAYALSQSGAL